MDAADTLALGGGGRSGIDTMAVFIRALYRHTASDFDSFETVYGTDHLFSSPAFTDPEDTTPSRGAVVDDDDETGRGEPAGGVVKAVGNAGSMALVDSSSVAVAGDSRRIDAFMPVNSALLIRIQKE